ncbi:hypothetical protein PSI23_18415 [Xenorhabdus sp. XENO-10]|uniref:Uncharacterized protein n=1 Tax=Xenorhabdus yunnanensis TaxID=3025878 RepID=A0ABT5LL49_9GAMM|nr:hypothetical protein [Xenorhabdus yunnanensis]MDC9591208.1 hypothetical protein [Xenorhabdus yunnanensis]
MMSDSLDYLVFLERIEFLSRMGGLDNFNDKDRQVVLNWIWELVEQAKSEMIIIEKPLNSGSTLNLCGRGLQQI